jgi:hypothetical protein
VKVTGKSSVTGKAYDEAILSVSDQFRRLKGCSRIDSIDHWVGIQSISTDEVWTLSGCGGSQAFDLMFIPLGNTGEKNFMSTLRSRPKPTLPSSTESGDVYTTIDTSTSRQAIQALGGTEPTMRQATIRAVRERPERYAPPVFYAMAHALHATGESRDALFWLHAGRLRALYDSLRSADQLRARKATSALEFSVTSDLAETLKTSKAQLQVIVEDVLSWDAKTPYEYDHRWITLHSSSVGSMTLAKKQAQALSAPESDWPQLRERARATMRDAAAKTLSN